MTRAEMLKSMGLTEDEFRQLLVKFGVFYASLRPNQRAVVNRALPSLRRAARSLGRDVASEDLREMLKSPAECIGIFIEWDEVEEIISNKTDNDDNDDKK